MIKLPIATKESLLSAVAKGDDLYFLKSDCNDKLVQTRIAKTDTEKLLDYAYTVGFEQGQKKE